MLSLGALLVVRVLCLGILSVTILDLAVLLTLPPGSGTAFASTVSPSALSLDALLVVWVLCLGILSMSILGLAALLILLLGSETAFAFTLINKGLSKWCTVVS